MHDSAPATNGLPGAGGAPHEPLPPVEPPSAGFIVQLFLIPGVIVAVIVAVWLLFNWLAQMGNDPASYVEAIKQKRRHDTRWHAAVNLSNALRENSALKDDRQLAKELAQVLTSEIDAGEMEDEAVRLRIFLCKALGEFYVADVVLPALLKAVNTHRGEAENPVRVAGLEGIAVLAENVRAAQRPPLSHESLDDTLLRTSRSDQRLTRSAAAFALGVVGEDWAQERLRVMLDDSSADVRYNAAIGLARHGNVEAIPTLEEMLAADQSHALEVEEEQARAFKRTLIHVNALRAVAQLADANKTADLSPLRRAIESLLATNVTDDVRTQASASLAALDAQGAALAAGLKSIPAGS